MKAGADGRVPELRRVVIVLYVTEEVLDQISPATHCNLITAGF